MKKTKINGYPGFGIPSEKGEDGAVGNNVYFADEIVYETMPIDGIHGNPYDNKITYEYYQGRRPKDENEKITVIWFKISYKPHHEQLSEDDVLSQTEIDEREKTKFKDGDIIVVNVDRCCFYKVVFNELSNEAYIENIPMYKLTLSPLKLINFSLSAELSINGDSSFINLYTSLIVEKEDLIKDFHIELIKGHEQINYRKSLDEVKDNDVISIPLESSFIKGGVTVNVYAVCKTHSMGYREYLVGTEKVGG